MEVKVLGSVSPYNKGNKKCPGYLVKTDKAKILLDCGNGATGLLDMSQDLEGLNVFITHLHKDHYGDIMCLAYATFVYHNLGLLKEKVNVYIPKPDYVDVNGKSTPIIDYVYLNNLGPQSYMNVITYDTSDTMEVGDCKISFALNPHDVITHSIKVEDGDTTLVYSGDTGFKDNQLGTFAKNSTLLICEATFLRGQKGLVDHHLCAYEAAMIADMAQVKQLMLTHFWPEIEKQEYVNEALPIFKNTIYAEEGKVLKLKNNQL